MKLCKPISIGMEDEADIYVVPANKQPVLCKETPSDVYKHKTKSDKLSDQKKLAHKEQQEAVDKDQRKPSDKEQQGAANKAQKKPSDKEQQEEAHKTQENTGVNSCDIFKPKKRIMKNEKTIMVVGATGRGKTTLINRMINYLFGVKYSNTCRFRLIEETKLSETKSNTKDITKYTLYRSRLEYNITVIDTPGFDSTEGKYDDQSTLAKIKYLFESGNVEAVDAICIVENCAITRLTLSQIYVYKTIATTFGKNVKDNVFIMITHCNDLPDGDIPSQPLAILENFTEEGIPYKLFCLFNNKHIYKKQPRNPTKATIENAYWDMSTKSFEQFFESLGTTNPISLKLTTEILNIKFQIKEIKLPHLTGELQRNINEIKSIELDINAIDELIRNPDKSRYSKKVSVTKVVMVPIENPNWFTTKCKNCNWICHYPCDIHEKNFFYNSLYWCSAMSWQFIPGTGKATCMVCPGKCSWKDHEQIKERRIFKNSEEEITDESLRKKYMEGKRGDMSNLRRKCNTKLIETYQKLLDQFKEIETLIDYINKNSLCAVPITIKEFVEEIIKCDQEDGYQERVHYLKCLVMMSHPTSTDAKTSMDKAMAFINLCNLPII